MLERIQDEIETYVILLFEFSSPTELTFEQVQKQLSILPPEIVKAPVFGVSNLSYSFETTLNEEHPPFLKPATEFERASLSRWDFWRERTGDEIVVRDSDRVVGENELRYVCALTVYVSFDIDYEWDWDNRTDEYWDELRYPVLSSLIVDFGTLSEVGVYAGFDGEI